MKSSGAPVIAPFKKWFLIISLALVLLAGCSEFARSVTKNQKAPDQPNPTTRKVISRHPKSIAQQKADFRRWLNDPKIEEVERAARKVLKWKIYNAADCGFMYNYEQTDSVNEHQKIIRQATGFHKDKKPFIYCIQIVRPTEGLSPSAETYIADYRAVTGTRNGEVYEFWWDIDKTPMEGPMTFAHRKWKKPTFQKKGNDILFFDAGQKTK